MGLSRVSIEVFAATNSIRATSALLHMEFYVIERGIVIPAGSGWEKPAA